MKRLDEVHKIMEKIYKEEKNLSVEERVQRIRVESEKFLREHKIDLKRVASNEPKYILR